MTQKSRQTRSRSASSRVKKTSPKTKASKKRVSSHYSPAQKTSRPSTTKKTKKTAAARKKVSKGKKKTSVAPKNSYFRPTLRKKSRRGKNSFIGFRTTERGERNAMILTFLFLGMTLFGLINLLSASSVTSFYTDGDSFSQFERQSVMAVVGGIVFVFLSRIDYRRIRKTVPLLLAVTFVLLILVLLPGVGTIVKGARRWLDIGPFRIQPAEIAKFALIVFVAHLLALRERRMDRPELTVRPVMVILFAMCGLLFLQPKLSTALILGFIAVVMLFVAGARVSSLLPWFGLGLAGFLVAILLSGHAMPRIKSFFNPSDNAAGVYQAEQSQISVADGSWFGTGLGGGKGKWGSIPEVETDFIFSSMAEEIGLVGSAAFIVIHLVIAWFGLQAALHAPDRFGMLLAVGITCWIVSQSFLNIGVVLGVLPTTGVTLPFVSAGGSSLVMVLAAAGLLTNVARRARYHG